MHEVSTKFILMISFLSLKGTEFCHFLKSTFNHISYQDKPVNWWDIELLGLVGGRGVGEQERECGLCSRTDQCSAIWGWEDVLNMSSLNFIINKSGHGYRTETQIAQHLRHWNHTTNLSSFLHRGHPALPLTFWTCTNHFTYLVLTFLSCQNEKDHIRWSPRSLLVWKTAALWSYL